MNQIKQLKNQLRREMLSKRRRIDETVVLEKSRVIEKRLLETSIYTQSRTIMFYISHNNEVYTHTMIKKSLKQGKTVVVPKIKNNIIYPSILTSWSELTKGSYGVLEPREIKPVSLNDIDIVIVPGVVFDQQGYRIGHGGGYYDRFLEKTSAIKIALAFEFQVLPSIPHEEHDIKVDKIITERRLINC